jgi:hypothetical protein
MRKIADDWGLGADDGRLRPRWRRIDLWRKKFGSNPGQSNMDAVNPAPLTH